MNMIEQAKAAFANDVAEHEMHIILDTPPLRHITYCRPGDCFAAFSLTTVPGTLFYAGDMGAFSFSRTGDMFQFFRGEGGIDYDYWHQKLVATDACPVVKKVSYRFVWACHAIRLGVTLYDAAKRDAALQALTTQSQALGMGY